MVDAAAHYNRKSTQVSKNLIWFVSKIKFFENKMLVVTYWDSQFKE